MTILPDKLNLAHLPTPIEKLKSDYGANIYLKRDDLTGIELSGNKVRKLEYVLSDALKAGADVIISCGGVQSNHARATAVAAAKVGLKCHLVLRHDGQLPLAGNVILDQLFGATITTIPAENFTGFTEKIQALVADYQRQGLKAYAIPVGASNAIGNFGYLNSFYEILEDEKRLGINFDTIVCTVGSGGTYSGLWLGNYLSGAGKRIVGINISDSAGHFKTVCSDIATQTLHLLGCDEQLKPEDFTIIDGFAGRGYALSSQIEIDFIKQIVLSEGVFFDPVYTGKCFRGLIKTLKDNPQQIVDDLDQNVLFIHTGGLFALFAKGDLFF